MHHYCLPRYVEKEAIYDLRVETIKSDPFVINKEQALQELSKNHDIEFDFWTIEDVWREIGIPMDHIWPEGYLVLRGKKPEISIDGVSLEEFKNRQKEAWDRFEKEHPGVLSKIDDQIEAW